MKAGLRGYASGANRSLRQLSQGFLYKLGLWNGPVPHTVKRRVIRRRAVEFNARCFVETGTYLGDMIAAMRPRFDRLYSIELSHDLFVQAERRFHSDGKVFLRHGDSGSELQRILRDFDQRALFWLDAHYSGGFTARGAIDSPIVTELNHIADHRVRDHVILIDDARMFVGKDGYPTLAQLEVLAAERFPRHRLFVEQDIIQLLPRQAYSSMGR
jgi:hypothetical protein